ncbi:MAG TPA: NrfD/PsrC family molybdoenzyme membrane anchor subunit [Isosphaeraceae bacterium]|nr:NrfD/PsrC family molybdoenzyme membrane anchor subunit [Isosphaeraceae bacterium]
MENQVVLSSQNSSYADSEITKPPNWHALVSWDMLFNNLSTGLYLVAAVGDLLFSSTLGPVSRLAYPLALLLLLSDLGCLVLDLGDPLRFHHMLRVFKPSSPMSFGTWSLTIYSVPLTLIVGLDALSWLGLVPSAGEVVGIVRGILLVLGIPPALGSAVYKGVLFSTSAQPGWKDARWLGAYMANSAVMLGCAQMLIVAHLSGQSGAVSMLSPLLAVLLGLNLIVLGLLVLGLWPTLKRVVPADRLTGDALIVIVGGFAVPILFSLGRAGTFAWLVGLVALLGANFVVRHLIVMLPHMAREIRRHPDPTEHALR